MKIIDRDEIYRIISMDECVKLMKKTLSDLDKEISTQYLRTAVVLPNTNVLGLMPAWLGSDYFGVKVISVYHTNGGTAYPSHQGNVLLFESKNGSLLASLDATSITQIRTGAVSATATDLLATKDAKKLALLGSGAQARSHLEAILTVRDIDSVTVWDINQKGAERFRSDMEQKFKIKIKICETAKDAVLDADIICTVTASKTPVLCGEWVKKGAHINAVGACAAKDRELDSSLVASARLYCDNTDAILNEGGDFLIPKAEGIVNDNHILGTVGQLINGRIEGRTDDSQITIFEALGLAVEDVAAAKYLYEKSPGKQEN